MPEKRKTSFLLTAEALQLLAQLAERLGISRGAVLELAIRREAKRAGITKEPSE